MLRTTALPSAACLLAAVCFCFCLIIIPHSSAQTLQSLISLSKDLAANPSLTTVGSINTINSNGSSPTPVCYLPYLSTFSRDDGPPNNNGQYDGLAAISLALEHLNTGNGTIVRELNGINEKCPLRFYTNAFDIEAKKALAVNHVIDLTDHTGEQLVPCAILSAMGSGITMSTAIISGIRDFPQISGLATSNLADDEEQYKYFGRTIPNDDGTAMALIQKLKSWGVEHLAVLHLSNSYGNSFADGIRVAAQTEAPDLRVTTVNVNPAADDTGISNAINQLNATQYTYFFGIIYPQDFVDRVMTEAYVQKIAGTGLHTWLFSDSVGSTLTSRGFPIGSSLEKAFRGTGILKATSSAPGLEGFDRLSSAMQQLKRNEDDLSFINDHLPLHPEESTRVTGQESFLSSPGFVAPFLYDAAVSLGLSACNLVSSGPEPSKYFAGGELFEEFLQTTFEGASGSVVLDDVTGTRTPQSAMFSLTNYMVDKEESGQGMVHFKGFNTGLFQSGQWTYNSPFTFNDGTSNIPLDLPPLETHGNHLSTGSKVVGLILCGIIVILSIAFGVWTYCNREKKAVRASQPIFLYFIALGTLLMGAAIIPLTIDLGGTDEKGADAACMAFPWLMAVGFTLTFSALFTKTYRIKQIMRSAAKCKRLTLTSVDVMKPMLVLLLLNIIVLAVWTAMDPLQREVSAVAWDVFNREIETYSTCTCQNYYIYLSVLCAINFGALIYSLIQAWQARDISTEFSESTYIFRAMAVLLYVSFIAIPVLILAHQNRDAYYFVTAGFIFAICSSILLLIFLPKVIATRKKNETPPPKPWQMAANRVAEERKETLDESNNGVGIQVFSASAKALIENENAKLKHICKTLSTRCGVDYSSLMKSDDPEQHLANDDENGTKQLCMAISEED